ncbi:MAG: TrkA family potassium uptake protein [Chloroflexi bacterium]|nr:TrkA family potassium uptake protein [Chloroflexota bacterium]
MRLIILGCGRLGAHLARRLDREGNEVVVIDRNAEAFARLGSDFRGRMVFGTGIDEDVLRRAGIERVDAFVAVTNGDNTNAMASEIAKLVFKVPRVVARLYDPVREDTFHTLGVIETVCPTLMGSDQIHDLLAGPNSVESSRAAAQRGN